MGASFGSGLLGGLPVELESDEERFAVLTAFASAVGSHFFELIGDRVAVFEASREDGPEGPGWEWSADEEFNEKVRTANRILGSIPWEMASYLEVPDVYIPGDSTRSGTITAPGQPFDGWSFAPLDRIRGSVYYLEDNLSNGEGNRFDADYVRSLSRSMEQCARAEMVFRIS